MEKIDFEISIKELYALLLGRLKHLELQDDRPVHNNVVMLEVRKTLDELERRLLANSKDKEVRKEEHDALMGGPVIIRKPYIVGEDAEEVMEIRGGVKVNIDSIEELGDILNG